MLKHKKDTEDNFSKTFLLMRTLQDVLPKLQKRFCGITITSVNKQQRWGIINYTKENHRQLIINYIQKEITSQIIIKHKNIHKIYPHDPKKNNQYSRSNDINKIEKLQTFLYKFSYFSVTPTLRSKNNFNTHELTWNTPKSIQRNMHLHWSSLNIPLKINKSNINLHIEKQKTLANYHLNQLLKFQLQKITKQLPVSAQNIIKFYSHQIYDKEVLPITESSILLIH